MHEMDKVVARMKAIGLQKDASGVYLRRARLMAILSPVERAGAFLNALKMHCSCEVLERRRMCCHWWESCNRTLSMYGYKLKCDFVDFTRWVALASVVGVRSWPHCPYRRPNVAMFGTPGLPGRILMHAGH